MLFWLLLSNRWRIYWGSDGEKKTLKDYHQNLHSKSLRSVAKSKSAQPQESQEAVETEKASVMTTIEERVRALEVSMESIDKRLHVMEKRLFVLGGLLIGACNAFDLVSLFQ